MASRSVRGAAISLWRNATAQRTRVARGHSWLTKRSKLNLLARSQSAFSFQSSNGFLSASAAMPLCGIGSAGYCSSSGNDGLSFATIAKGDRVVIHFQGRSEDGKDLGKSEIDKPVEFIAGSKLLLTEIEEAVIGLQKGSKVQVVIKPKQFKNPEEEEKRMATIPRDRLQISDEEWNKLEVGNVLTFSTGDSMRIVTIHKDSIDVDVTIGSKPSEIMYFDIEVVDHVPMDQLPIHERLVMPEELSPGDNMTFPNAGDRLVMHYDGRIAADGKEFDSSRKRGKPFEFTIGVGEVIPGWDEGVMQMSKGQKARLFVPSQKGYGPSGAGDVIPPNADLIFDVELLDIIRK